jgi:hypothetical protein
MGDLRVKILLFNAKIMLKSLLIKSNHRVTGENKIDTNEAPVSHLIIAPLF